MAGSGDRHELAHWRDHLVVCGDSPLAVQVVRELAAWSGCRVAVISPSGYRAGSFTGLSGVRVVEGSVESDDVLQAAGVADAAGLAALLPDDVDNRAHRPPRPPRKPGRCAGARQPRQRAIPGRTAPGTHHPSPG